MQYPIPPLSHLHLLPKLLKQVRQAVPPSPHAAAAISTLTPSFHRLSAPTGSLLPAEAATYAAMTPEEVQLHRHTLEADARVTQAAKERELGTNYLRVGNLKQVSRGSGARRMRQGASWLLCDQGQ
jgi:hypothetical protein